MVIKVDFSYLLNKQAITKVNKYNDNLYFNIGIFNSLHILITVFSLTSG